MALIHIEQKLDKIVELLTLILEHARHPMFQVHAPPPLPTTGTWPVMKQPCRWCGKYDCYETHVFCHQPLKNGDTVTMTGSVGAIS